MRFVTALTAALVLVGVLLFSSPAYGDETPSPSPSISATTAEPEASTTTEPEATPTESSEPTEEPTTASPEPEPSDTTVEPEPTEEPTETPEPSEDPTTASPEPSDEPSASDSPSETPTPDTNETITVCWLMPDGGTPDNVTWPQMRTSCSPAPTCDDQWVQIDTYPYGTTAEKAQVENLGGTLTNGEDHGFIISWDFKKIDAKDCTPVVPKPNASWMTPTCDDPIHALEIDYAGNDVYYFVNGVLHASGRYVFEGDTGDSLTVVAKTADGEVLKTWEFAFKSLAGCEPKPTPTPTERPSVEPSEKPVIPSEKPSAEESPSVKTTTEKETPVKKAATSETPTDVDTTGDLADTGGGRILWLILGGLFVIAGAVILSVRNKARRA